MMNCINRQTFKQKIKSYRHQPLSLLLYIAVCASALITAGVVIFLIGYILYHGLPNLTLPGLFAWDFNAENQSMTPAIINTVIMILLTLLLAVPVGVFAAIYLVEYSKRGNKLVKVIRITAETLSGIPSIVYGLFGYIVFVITLGWSFTLLSGVITMAIMILPLIMRTTEEALMAVPDSFREGSFGLGAGKLRTVFRIVLPSAMPGILSGVILAIGRIVGESAALLFTAGFGLKLNGFVKSLRTSSATLTVALYIYASEQGKMDVAFAIAAILLVLTLMINFSATLTGKKLRR